MATIQVAVLLLTVEAAAKYKYNIPFEPENGKAFIDTCSHTQHMHVYVPPWCVCTCKSPVVQSTNPVERLQGRQRQHHFIGKITKFFIMTIFLFLW